MDYQPSIPADSVYLQALGRAFYNFTYLEWIVVWTIVKLSSDGFGSVPRHETAGKIARALHKAIHETTPPLPKDLRCRLVKFHEAYLEAIRLRNKLLHAHPYTASSGAQQLISGNTLEWPIEKVYEAAKLFDDASSMGSEIFHSDLARVRP